MPAPIPVKLRQVACKLAASGEFTQEQVVELLESYGSTASIKRWLKLLQETGSLEPRYKKPGPKPALNEELLAVMRGIVEERPDLTLSEIADEFTARTGKVTSTSSVSRALISLGLTRKKNARGRGTRRRADSRSTTHLRRMA